MATYRQKKSTRWRVVSCVAAVVTLAVGFGVGPAPARPSSPGAPAQESQPAPPGEWTVLVYMAADNNLEPSALTDLEEMAAAAGPGVTILAMIDRSQIYTSRPVFGEDFTTARLIEITEAGPRTVSDVGEIPTMNAGNLAWFTWYGLTNYPAERRAFFLWDHGGGPLQTFGADEDEGDRDFLSIPEIQQGLGSGMRAAGVDTFDIIGFDACLNAAFDIATALTSYADYFIASEEVEPLEGWDWTALDVLSQGSDVDGARLGQEIISRYEQHVLENSGSQDYTLSLVDLDGVERLREAMTGFVSALRADLATNGPALLQARQGMAEFGVLGPDPAGNLNLVDLGALIARLPDTLSDEVLRARNAVYEAIGKSVVHQVVGPVHADATGLSVYLPPSGAAYHPGYDAHAEMTGWRQLLAELLGEGASLPSADGTDVGDIDVAVDASGWLATLPLDADSVAGAAAVTGLFGVPNGDGTTTLLTTFDGTFAAGGTDQVQASWSYAFITLGGQAVTADMQATADGGVRAAIPGVYVDPSGSQLQSVMNAEMSPSGDGLNVSNVSIFDASGTAGAITVVSGSQFVPLLVNLSGSDVTESELGTPIDPSSPQVGTAVIPSGSTFHAGVQVTFPDGTTVGDATTATRP